MWSHHSGPFKGCISLTLTAWFFSWDCEDLVLIMHGTSDKTPPQTSSHPGIMISKERWSSMRGWLWNKQLSTCSTTLVANVIVLISICNAHFHWQLSKWQMPLALNQYGSWMTNNSCLWVTTTQMKISMTTVKENQWALSIQIATQQVYQTAPVHLNC